MTPNATVGYDGPTWGIDRGRKVHRTLQCPYCDRVGWQYFIGIHNMVDPIAECPDCHWRWIIFTGLPGRNGKGET